MQVISDSVVVVVTVRRRSSPSDTFMDANRPLVSDNFPALATGRGGVWASSAA
jgi:hypothetical protein